MTSEENRGRSSPALLVLAFAAYSAAHLFNNTVLQRAGARTALDALQAASGGWIAPVLVRSQVVLAAFLAVVIGLGRRRLADVGWSARRLLPGLGIALGAWAMLQAVLLLTVLLRGAPLAWHASWSRDGLAAVGAGVLAQALGHALVEDTAFRGFFLPELRARLVRPGSVLALVGVIGLCIAGSSLLFGLAHLPTRALVRGSGVVELLEEQWEFFSAGVALGLAFVTTRNLFAVVGLHVMLNAPAPLVQVPGLVLRSAVLCVFAAVVVLSAGSAVRAWYRRTRAREPGVERDERQAA